jgi:hypothetical protein
VGKGGKWALAGKTWFLPFGEIEIAMSSDRWEKLLDSSTGKITHQTKNKNKKK